MEDKADPTGQRALLAALASGEEWAFERLYRLYGSRLYRAARGLGRQPQEAEDAVQDVFLGLVRSRRRLLAVRDLISYLFVALRHAAARSGASRLRDTESAETAAVSEVPDVTGQHGGTEYDVRLEHAVAALPPEQREVLSLKIDGELTFAEIARVLGISPNTAASRYRYALEKLRARFKEG